MILETGMGGRLDATNVVPNPLCTIITTLSQDHEKFLGDTLDKIAFEKGGIIKAGCPCIIGYQTNQAIEAGVMEIFHTISTKLSTDAPLYHYGSQWNIEAVQGSLKFTWFGESIVASHPNLVGLHQIYNCGAAIAAYRVIMGDDFDPSILSPDNPNNPLCIIQWSGRLQKLVNEPFRAHALDSQEVWLDGGHNDSAGMMLAEQFKVWQETDPRPLHLIIAMVNRKTPAEFLTPLTPHAESVTVTHIEGEDSSFSVDELYELVAPLGFKEINKAQSPAQACTAITDPNARILITGSLYLLGNVL